jgi:hypothetical protein
LLGGNTHTESKVIPYAYVYFFFQNKQTKNSARTSQETHYASAKKAHLLMLFMERDAVYCKNHTKHKLTACMMQNFKQVGARIAQSVQRRVGRTEFDPRKEQDIFLFSAASKQVLGPTQSSIQWVSEAFPGRV